MLAVSTDDAMATRVEDILEAHGTVDLDSKETSWKQEGWKGYSAGAVGSPTGAHTASMGTAGSALGNLGAEKLSIVEEQLRIGKRQVNSGRVKVRSYVIETPVSEQVSLRNESVHVERVAVDRAVAAGEDPFRDRTIEATATSEEAVVSKEARVTGEVLLRKEVGQRTETVTEKVRSTKVEVDDANTVAGAASDKALP